MKFPRWPQGAILAILAVLSGGCADETAVSGAAGADSSAAKADAGAGDTAATGPVPAITGSGHGKGGYVEISGGWDPAAKRLKAWVWVGDVADLLGIAAHLRYDPAKLQLTKLELLPLAELGDDNPGVWSSRGVAKDAPAGRILLGSARFRNQIAPFVYPAGAAVQREKWVALEFAVLAAGESKLWFDPPSKLARQGDGKALQLEWLDAQVQVPAASVGGAP